MPPLAYQRQTLTGEHEVSCPPETEVEWRFFEASAAELVRPTLVVTMEFFPEAAGQVAPTLHAWQQVFDFVRRLGELGRARPAAQAVGALA